MRVMKQVSSAGLLYLTKACNAQRERKNGVLVEVKRKTMLERECVGVEEARRNAKVCGFFGNRCLATNIIPRRQGLTTLPSSPYQCPTHNRNPSS